MSVVLLQLGGHVVAVEGSSTGRFLSSYNGAVPFILTGATPEWSVIYDEGLPSVNGFQILSEFTLAENDSRCSFSRYGDCYRFVVVDKDSSDVLVDMRYTFGENVVVASPCHDVSALRFSLWFAVSMLSASSRLSFVHASTVVCKGRAVLFLGESGTGKSTHSRLWLKYVEGSHLLNDDSPMLSLSGTAAEVYGSPWSGKTPCYNNRHFPVAAIVRLSQAPHNSIRPLSAIEAFGALQPSLPPALMQDDRFADILNDMVADMVGLVPFYGLSCLPDADAARLCSSTIQINNSTISKGDI